MNEYNDKRDLRFEEYKLFRDTAHHFDKILIDIRKSAISLAFIIFGLAVETFRVASIPFGLTPIDLAIALILIELLIVLSFFYLESHYRFYLVKITTIASEYEKKLEMGIKLENCDDLGCSDKKVGISKCLKCNHDNQMAFSTRVAHYNIYISLLALGFVTLNTLIEIKLGLSYKEVLVYSIITGFLVFGSFIIYGLRNIKKGVEEEDRLNDEFSLYLIFIIFFISLTYISYYYINLNFTFSFFGALGVSAVIFFAYGFNKAKIDGIFIRLMVCIGVMPKKFLNR